MEEGGRGAVAVVTRCRCSQPEGGWLEKLVVRSQETCSGLICSVVFFPWAVPLQTERRFRNILWLVYGFLRKQLCVTKE